MDDQNYSVDQVASALGMVQTDYSFLMGLSGLLIGLSFLFITLFVVVNISKGKN